MVSVSDHIFVREGSREANVSELDGVEKLRYRTGFIVRGNLVGHDKDRLEAVLNAKLQDEESQENGSDDTNYSFAVAARRGTLSSQSSNISAILDDVGLEGDARVEPVEFYDAILENAQSSHAKARVTRAVHDPMIQGVYREHGNERRGLQKIFSSKKPQPVEHLDVTGGDAKKVLARWCEKAGTSLSDGMMDRLIKVSRERGTPLTDVECFAFSQANSEHCRHQTFGAKWTIDGKPVEGSLMDLIRATHKANPSRVVSAYTDNAAVFRRENDGKMKMLKVDHETGQYYFDEVEAHLTAKLETHNHPSAISPYPGAATGSGGEIRDEGAVGTGAKTAHGTSTFVVADGLFDDPYNLGQNPKMATPLKIMTDGPLGSSDFNNEYGRPATTGTFTAYTAETRNGLFGFPKPIMGAGGAGIVEKKNAFKPSEKLPVDTRLVQIGGPGLRIGLGGASGSSAGLKGEEVDFSSVQRGNAEMQRRCQKVIDRCAQMKQNPILAIHDCGAGGIGNAFVELGEMGRQGAEFWLDKAMLGDSSLASYETWSNEAQERYVLALSPEDYDEFKKICEAEGVPLSWMGIITEGDTFHVKDADEDLIKMKFDDFFYKESPTIEAESIKDRGLSVLDITTNTRRAAMAVLAHPTVGSKEFLVTIGDQTVGGLTTQNQMAGPWRVPVADVGVQRDGFREATGHAMVSAEALSIAPIDPAASVRMAIAESLTNLLAADVSDIKNVIFSGNWMANLKDASQYIDLRTAVEAASEFCIELGIPIPTGKDSFSMQATWKNKLEKLRKDVKIGAPVTGLFTAFSPVADAEGTLTPYLQPQENTELLFIDMADGKQRLGGSILAQVHKQIGDECPDVDAQTIKNLYKAIIRLKREGKILAYHDRSTGGLMTTLSEMAFASHAGLDIDISDICENSEEQSFVNALFNQEAGIVVQISSEDRAYVMQVLSENGLGSSAHTIARPRFESDPNISIKHGENTILESPTAELHKTWSTNSDKIREQRENPDTVTSDRDVTHDYSRGAIEYKTTFDVAAHPAHAIIADYESNGKEKPKVAILRAPGTNGDQEMANKFMMAGFDAYDVRMSDLKNGKFDLADFQCLAACGGFSYGDTLGAGSGWAQSILCDPELSEDFAAFFARTDTCSLGVCNGNQMMAQIRELIPGANHFPDFKPNTSEIFESRSVDVAIPESNAVPFKNMAGSVLPIVVSHGEGRAEGDDVDQGVMQFVNEDGDPTNVYPLNPNGTSSGNTAYTNEDGRHTIMMPHPERVNEFDQMFYNMREWAEQNKAA